MTCDPSNSSCAQSQHQLRAFLQTKRHLIFSTSCLAASALRCWDWVKESSEPNLRTLNSLTEPRAPPWPLASIYWSKNDLQAGWATRQWYGAAPCWRHFTTTTITTTADEERFSQLEYHQKFVWFQGFNFKCDIHILLRFITQDVWLWPEFSASSQSLFMKQIMTITQTKKGWFEHLFVLNEGRQPDVAFGWHQDSDCLTCCCGSSSADSLWITSIFLKGLHDHDPLTVVVLPRV